MKCHVLCNFIWVYTVYKSTRLCFQVYNELNIKWTKVWLKLCIYARWNRPYSMGWLYWLSFQHVAMWLALFIPGLDVIKLEFHSQTQNKAQWLVACGHVSASNQSLRFILSLRLCSSFITSRPETPKHKLLQTVRPWWNTALFHQGLSCLFIKSLQEIKT